MSRRNTIAAGIVGVLVIAAMGSQAGQGGTTGPSATPGQAAQAVASVTLGATPSPLALAPTPQTTPTPLPTPTPAPTPEPTPDPTPEPTPEPTPDPTPEPVTFSKLTSRSWAKLVKDPDTYAGEHFQIWACISQFDAATGTDTFRGQASYANQTYWYSDGDNALFTGDDAMLADSVEDDVVSMYVTVIGAYTYETQIGGSATAPSFEVNKITRRGSC